MAWARHHLTEKQAADIILNCHTTKDDQRFSFKYDVLPNSVRDIRLGLSWWRLRRKLESKRPPGLVWEQL